MSSINAPIVEYFPFWPVEIGNELFWYIFDGETPAKWIAELDENKSGLGIELSDKYLDKFEIISRIICYLFVIGKIRRTL